MAKGISPGNAEKIPCNAGGPPVEAPMATTEIVSSPRFLRCEKRLYFLVEITLGSFSKKFPPLPDEGHIEIEDSPHFFVQILTNFHQLFKGPGRWLENEINSPQFQSLEHAFITTPGTYHDHRCRTVAHNDAQQGKTVHPRHLEVEGDKIGLQIQDATDALFAIHRIADHFNLGKRLQYFGYRSSIEGRIIYDKNPDLVSHDPSPVNGRRFLVDHVAFQMLEGKSGRGIQK